MDENEMKTTLSLTADEFYEVNDALNEVVRRMLADGQTEDEIKFKSLKRLWSAWRKLAEAKFGTPDTPGMLGIAAEVEGAIGKPKRRARPASRDLRAARRV